jgi:quinoprotein glucose dehydrogenase
VLYVSSSEMAWSGALLPASQSGSTGALAYQSQCAVCHGVDRAGVPPAFPSLVGILDRSNADQVRAVLKNGKGRMPAFPSLDDKAIESLLDYLRTSISSENSGGSTEALNTPQDAYIYTGYRKFLDPDGYPAITPPWGTLNAIDLNTGKYLWKIPLGEYPELAKQGIKNTGSELYGGPIVTAGGLVFIGATVADRKFRAFDSTTGKLLWETELPFAGVATPATYMVDGRQYVVIASSGGRDPNGPVGGSYVAFALPVEK